MNISLDFKSLVVGMDRLKVDINSNVVDVVLDRGCKDLFIMLKEVVVATI